MLASCKKNLVHFPDVFAPLIGHFLGKWSFSKIEGPDPQFWKSEALLMLSALHLAPWSWCAASQFSKIEGLGPQFWKKAPTINESSWTRHQSKIAQNYCWFTVQRSPLICMMYVCTFDGSSLKKMHSKVAQWKEPYIYSEHCQLYPIGVSLRI